MFVAVGVCSGGEVVKQMSNNKKPIYLFLYFFSLLILIYAVQDFRTSRNTVLILGADRGGVHIAIFVILVILGNYYAATVWGGTRRSPVKLALWLIAIWIAAVNLAQSASIWSMATHLGLSMLWVLSYHFFSNYLQRFPGAFSRIQICGAIMFVFYLFSALYAIHTIHAYLIQRGQDRLPVINLAYNAIVFLPWLSVVAGKKKRLLGYGIVFLVVLASMKRGAIIVFPLMLGASMLVEAVINKKPLWRQVLRILFMFILFFTGLLAANQVSNGYLSKRFSAEQLASGSGRAELYSAGLNEISQRSFFNLLIGRGSGAGGENISMSLHNEWLEFLFDFGIIGVMLYAFLLFILIREMWQLIKKSSPYAPAYAMAILYMIIVGMVGQIYFAHSTFYIMAFYGAVEGLTLNNARNEQKLGAEYS